MSQRPQPPARDEPPSPSPTPDWRSSARSRAYAVCALCLTTAAVFFLTGVTPLPVLLYFPLSRRFGFQLAHGSAGAELTMDFYGRALLALLSGVATALTSYVVLTVLARRRTRARGSAAVAVDSADSGREQGSPADSSLLLFTAYAATALLLAVGLFAYQLAVRVPTPEPLPSGAQTATTTATTAAAAD